MKNFLKNALLSMLIVCFLLNIVNLTGLLFEYYMYTPMLEEIAKEVAQEVQTSEDTYKALAGFYYSGNGGKTQIQVVILVTSIILGIVMGLMIELEKKAKLKLVLTYTVGFITVVIAEVIFNIAKGHLEILQNLEWVFIVCGAWYTVFFIITFVVKRSISNKDVKKLNDILKSKRNK